MNEIPIKHSILGLLFCFLFQLGFGQQADEEQLRKHVYILASDSLQGRGTGTVGQKKAASYISDQFQAFGIIPLGDHYYDRFDIVSKHVNKVTLKQADKLIFTPWHFFFISNYNHNTSINSSMVFVGYGSEYEIERRGLKGKSLMLLANSPNEAYERINQLQKSYGVQEFFVVFPHPNPQVDMVWRKEFEHQKILLRSKYEQELSYKIKEPWVTLENLDSVNVFYCFENALESVFNKTDKQLFELADSNLNSKEEMLAQLHEAPMTCKMNYYDSLRVVPTENITGFIKGKDTSKTIVLTAHYDHVGIIQGKIHFGADDNASGTATLLEVARLLSIGDKPAYNVQFIAFSAEELGLLGSAEYVKHPFVAHENVVANINMDMVGRWDEKHKNNREFVYLLSAGDHSVDWYKQGVTHAKNLSIKVSKKPGAHEKKVFTYGSDHYSFYQVGVPVVVLFTGLHDDYHTPQDVPQKINFDNMTNIATLLSEMIRQGGMKK